MEYKILEINKEGWIKIEVDFKDGSKPYIKRMMSPIESDESIRGSVEKWLKDYLPLREKENSYTGKDLIGKKQIVSLKTLQEEV